MISILETRLIRPKELSTQFFNSNKLTQEVNKPQLRISLIALILVMLVVVLNETPAYCNSFIDDSSYNKDEINVTVIVSVAVATGRVGIFTRICKVPKGEFPDPNGAHASIGANHYSHIPFNSLETQQAHNVAGEYLKELCGVTQEDLNGFDVLVHSIETGVFEGQDGIEHWFRITFQEYVGYWGNCSGLDLNSAVFRTSEYFIDPVAGLESLATVSVMGFVLTNIANVVQNSPGFELTVLEEIGRFGDLGQLYMVTNDIPYTAVVNPMVVDGPIINPIPIAVPMNIVLDNFIETVDNMNLTSDIDSTGTGDDTLDQNLERIEQDPQQDQGRIEPRR